MIDKYSEEQIKNIQEREKKGLQALKDLQLTPACSAQMVNTGGDVFAIKLVPYLQDTQYTAQASPIQQEKV